MEAADLAVQATRVADSLERGHAALMRAADLAGKAAELSLKAQAAFKD